jgi:putative N6-adenine-specific DNA methylase
MSSSLTTQFHYFAVSAPGLEELLSAELTQLGLTNRVVIGGVEGRAAWPGLWDLHLKSALAESVRVRLKAFEAHDFATLEEGLGRLPWHAFVRKGQPLEVKVTCHRSTLYHSDAVKERVLKVVERSLERKRDDVAPQDPSRLPAAQLFVRLVRDVVTPSLGSSGERLHKRGYRQHVEGAPLRETLAAAMVQLLSQQAVRKGASALWDPFCGSGVLPLEWLRRCRGQLPNGSRAFAFEQWPSHPTALWHEHRDAALLASSAQLASAPSDEGALAWGSDIDAKAVESARNNAERAGLLPNSRFLVGDFRRVIHEVPKGAAVLSNPPYGKRLGSVRDAQRLFRDFERLLRGRPDLRPVVLACPDRAFLGSEGLRWRLLAETRHGGLPLAIVTLER